MPTTAADVLLDTIHDGLEPPTPPKLSAEEAQKFMEALQKGEPYRDRIEHSALADKARQLV